MKKKSLQIKALEDVRDSSFSEIAGLLEEVLTESRDVFVAATREKLFALMEAGLFHTGEGEQVSQSEWLKIDSLSQLRKEVGGRFDALRRRWVNAGFPLKEKRGEKVSEFSLDEKGWIELSSWISKQGFGCRLAPGGSEHLFEISPPVIKK